MLALGEESFEDELRRIVSSYFFFILVTNPPNLYPIPINWDINQEPLHLGN